RWPRTPEIRPWNGLPPEQPLGLPELGARTLGRHPPARTRPAHLLDTDFRRDRLRKLLRACTDRVPLLLLWPGAGGVERLPLLHPEHRSLPAPGPGHRLDGYDARDPPRRIHAVRALSAHPRRPPGRPARGVGLGPRYGTDAEPDLLARGIAPSRAGNHGGPAGCH